MARAMLARRGLCERSLCGGCLLRLPACEAQRRKAAYTVVIPVRCLKRYRHRSRLLVLVLALACMAIQLCRGGRHAGAGFLLSP